MGALSGPVRVLALGLLLSWAWAGAQELRTLAPAEAAPGLRDWARMYWADGLRGPHLRWIETGWFGCALDTDRLELPHLGVLPAADGYDQTADAPPPGLAALPAAQLELTLALDGRTYLAVSGGRPSATGGPRTIESGRFLQRADVTDLEFRDGRTALPCTARLETTAWPDRLAFTLDAQPGLAAIAAGPSFGRVGGGYGFDGHNHLAWPANAALEPANLTLECWVYLPEGPQPTRVYPWLVGSNGHEWAVGNIGLVLLDGRPRAYLSLGGGMEHCHFIDPAPNAPALSREAWHHLAETYDGVTFRCFVDGREIGQQTLNQPRQPGTGVYVFGKRGDNMGDGYHFAGALDEVRLWNRALSAAELAAHARSPESVVGDASLLREWCFDPHGPAAAGRPLQPWAGAVATVQLTCGGRTFVASSQPGEGRATLALAATPEGFVEALPSAVTVTSPQPVTVDAERGWQRLSLDGLQPVGRGNDAMERVRLEVANPTDDPQPLRLLLAKDQPWSVPGIQGITGMTAILRDATGDPTGLPVQMSKNWHQQPGRTFLYQGPWLHAASLLRLPPRTRVELELVLAYAHWGGVAAASHAQLCLVGWGSNQLWDQAAMGAWGESFCFEPDRAQAGSLVCDVRPLMVVGNGNGQPSKWAWTVNVGGADAFRLFDTGGRRVFPTAMRTTYHRQGPCLTEVTYAGRLAEAVRHRTTVSLHRSDDLARCSYHLRLDVERPLDLGRLVLWQLGSDSYNYTGERRLAVGNEHGVLREWATNWGGDTDRTPPCQLVGQIPWVSLHQAVPREPQGAAGWANRGFVLRSWSARLGGQPAAPWLVEHGANLGGATSSSADLVPPPGVKRLEPGDFVDAVIDHVVVPQYAKDYYGPNAALAAALRKDENTAWLLLREAAANHPVATVLRGALQRPWPLTLAAQDDAAEWRLSGGLGYVPVTVTGLRARQAPVLEECGPDGAWQPLNQSVHGRDWWQTELDPAAQTWSVTYTLPMDQVVERHLRLRLAAGGRSTAPN